MARSLRPRPLSQPVEDLDKYEIICNAAQYRGGYSISRLVDEPGTHRIYGLKDCSLWAVVDRVDWDYFSQWCWSYARSPWGKTYIARRTTDGKAATYRVEGYSFRRPGKTIYLHREILLRSGAVKPSKEHKIVSHENGNSLDCRRKNLRWSTYSENNTNQHGRSEGDEED